MQTIFNSKKKLHKLLFCYFYCNSKIVRLDSFILTIQEAEQKKIKKGDKLEEKKTKGGRQ